MANTDQQALVELEAQATLDPEQQAIIDQWSDELEAQRRAASSESLGHSALVGTAEGTDKGYVIQEGVVTDQQFVDAQRNNGQSVNHGPRSAGY